MRREWRGKTFRGYLRRQINRPGAIGDLARELAQDPEAPPRGGPFVIELYLQNHHAPYGALQACTDAAAEWRSNDE